ncbi:MAG: pyruvate, water dikinase regulatory protein [Magnetovibrionaceae bacterium]
MAIKVFNLHLVSDSTGETVGLMARASVAQFEGAEPREYIWNMIRNQSQVADCLEGIEAHPGFVLYTMVNHELRQTLEDGCRKLKVPCIAVLDPVVANLGSYLETEVTGQPGRQHVMDAEYFDRIEAMHYVLAHDDGQLVHDLDEADILLFGVSRTSKTPTCMYLANRGLKAANIPVVPGVPIPPVVMQTSRPLKVGLTCDPRLLIDIRRNRLKLLRQDGETAYVDPDAVKSEVRDAKRMFVRQGWPVIDVTRKSIEEVTATILGHLNRHRAGLQGSTPAKRDGEG